ncbi:helix-turn-helix domain-containing protein [Klebsiella variicola]|uniref:transcriptional regulator n=1 Tax=Klebsiella variicola TaxID=244366 RepID=UPI0022AF006E|nr:YdaS family helix-turn-helix protein [Klebsiella variicola]MCZ3532533.1 helix-turn-helix domain-containing protein [Klebsiella variicola]MDQ5599606.1 YdaS family helix-turn-helix protein [Klebsiella pneumoniae]
MKKEIKDLVSRRFTQAEIGQRLNVSQQTVFKWLKKQVPSGRVIPLCQLMGWEVTPHELRPDLHPTPISGIPEGVILPKKQEGV